MHRLETEQRFIRLYGMTIQDQTVSQRGDRLQDKMQKRQTDTVSFRLLQTIYSHADRYLQTIFMQLKTNT